MKTKLNIAHSLLCCFLLISSVNADAADPFKENLRQGEAAFQSGNYTKAIEFYEKVVEINPNYAPVYNALGLAHSYINAKLSDTVWFFKVAIDIDPKYFDAYHNMCKVYYQAGEHNQAEQACLKALSINPNLASAELSLAWIYLAGKAQPNDAIYYFNKVLDKVKNPMIYFGLGMAYAMNGDRAQVLDTITTLKAMGEVELANKLENSIRLNYEPPKAPGYVPTPKRETQLIKAGPPPAIPEAESGSSPAAGQMRIRLRGQLSNEQTIANPSQGTAGPQATPNTSSGSSNYQGGGTSAVERIRRLQRIRATGGGGETTLPKGSGY